MIDAFSNQRGCSAIPVKLPARSKRQRTANRHAKKEDVKAMSKFKNLDSVLAKLLSSRNPHRSTCSDILSDWHFISDIFWPSIWQIFRHSTWHLFWRTYTLTFLLAVFLASCLAFYLTSYLAFCLTFYLTYLAFYLTFNLKLSDFLTLCYGTC